MAGIVKMDQRNQSDSVSKKVHMAYGGAANDSLHNMLRNKKPVGVAPKHNTNITLTNQ